MIVGVIVQTLLQVPLGIQTKYKVKVTGMCSILDVYNKFIALEETWEAVNCVEKEVILDKSKVTQILLLGDQLTVGRLHGAVKVCRSYQKLLIA